MSFATALPVILAHEGGWANDPDDPGGATMYGITQRTYNAWRAEHHEPPQTVRTIPPAEVAAIYKTHYWDVVRCDDLPEPLDLVVFDAAVNHGPGVSVRFLQSCLGLKPNGRFDDAMLGKLRQVLGATPAHTLVECCLTERQAFYAKLVQRKPVLQKFLPGWTRRVTHLRTLTGS